MAVPMSFLFKPAPALSSLLLSLALVGVGSGALAQDEDFPVDGVEIEQPGQLEPTRPLGSSSSTLSISGGEALMAEAEDAIADQNYALATEKLEEAREKFNQLSNYYQELAQMFLGVDTQLHQSNREKALETAQLRDQTSYQLALVYRAQNQPDQAVPLLMEILRSQQPTRELGQQAYQQLFELGFVDEPYTGRSTDSETSSNE
jgi:tetratricopeptide (TPR) repeat protein